MATHSGILAWRIPWTEEPGRRQSMGSQRADMSEVTEHSTALIYAIHKSYSVTSHSFATPWTIWFKEFSRPESWSGLPFPSPGDLPDPGIKPGSPALQADSLPVEPPGKPLLIKIMAHISKGNNLMWQHRTFGAKIYKLGNWLVFQIVLAVRQAWIPNN